MSNVNIEARRNICSTGSAPWTVSHHDYNDGAFRFTSTTKLTGRLQVKFVGYRIQEVPEGGQAVSTTFDTLKFTIPAITSS